MKRKPVLTVLLALALVVAAAFGGATPALAIAEGATFTVNSAADIIDANPGDSVCNTTASPVWPTCTLRAAILEANAHPGADTIILPVAAEPYLLTISGANEDTGLTGDLDITGDLTLEGLGLANIPTVDGNSPWTEDRVFQISAGATVTMSNVKIQGGRLVAGSGGGIYNQGALTLNGVIVQGNSATEAFNGGGGIYNVGTLAMTQSQVVGNTCGGSCNGGGLYNTGALMLSQSALSYNGECGCVNPLQFGGGLYNGLAGSATLANSTVEENVAGLGGGGIYNFGALTLVNSTLYHNRVYVQNGDGGGIYNFGTLAVINSTLSGNLADEDGGGIYNLGTAKLYNATVVNNVADERADGRGGGIFNEPGAYFSLRNTIVASNRTYNDGFYTADDCYGSLVFSGYNLLRVNTDCSGYTGGDQVGTLNQPLDPKIGLLQDNGGPTETHALLLGSPAIDGGNPVACTDPQGATLTTDQRGYGRPVEGNIFGSGEPRCDIGAYEFLAGPATYKLYVPVLIK